MQIKAQQWKQILSLLDEQKLLLVAGQDTRMLEKQLVVLREQLEMERRAAEQLRGAAIEADKVKTSSQRMVQSTGWRKGKHVGAPGGHQPSGSTCHVRGVARP